MKKLLVGICAVVVLSSAVVPLLSSALTVGEIQSQISSLVSQIASLTSQLTSLRAQLDTTETTPPSSHPRICNVLNRNLYRGINGDDVSSVQEFLQTQGYFSASATGYFGPATASALAQWQSSEGLSSVGMVGPATRERIRVWCGNPNPTPLCKPVTYMPIACSDGTAAQPTHDSNGCITGYQCPVANFTPPANCKAWNDGCNVCSRTSPGSPAMCTLRACLADTNSIWAGKGYCTAYFDGTTGNLPPTISGFSGPTTLAVNTSGTWSVNASDPENGTLSYSITWGDENQVVAAYSMAPYRGDTFVQTSTFTHSYANTGTYTVRVTVRDSAGQTAQTSTTVQVGNGGVVCTAQYDPVCGQPPEPACRRSVPACMLPTPGPRTYSNRCELNLAGASFLYAGQCSNGY